MAHVSRVLLCKAAKPTARAAGHSLCMEGRPGVALRVAVALRDCLAPPPDPDFTAIARQGAQSRSIAKTSTQCASAFGRIWKCTTSGLDCVFSDVPGAPGCGASM